MINLQPSQYLEFENSICKIMKVDTTTVKLRSFSLGNTYEGYSYQRLIKISFLKKEIDSGRVRIIPWEEVMRILFFKLKKEN